MQAATFFLFFRPKSEKKKKELYFVLLNVKFIICSNKKRVKVLIFLEWHLIVQEFVEETRRMWYIYFIKWGTI